MNDIEQINEMARTIFESVEDSHFMRIAGHLYRNGYRKTFTSEFASDTQKAFKEGYEKARAEVALEVIGEVEKIIDKYYNRHIFGVEDLSDVEKEAVMNFSDDISGDLDNLKKEITGDGE